MAAGPGELLSELLPKVSRSFYLTLRILPAPVRAQMGLAYLMARASDTIADTALLPVAQRLEALRRFRTRVCDPAARFALGALAEHQSSPPERALIEQLDAVWNAFESLAPADRQSVSKALLTIVSGQELDVQRFGATSRQGIVCLESDAELEDYIYRVAGCVGEFWTEMCRRHLFPNAPLDEIALLDEAVRFGKGLQLVNVLRDLPADLRQGRCYLPAQQMRDAGLTAEDLLLPATMPALRPLYEAYLDRAESYLGAGWRYTNRLPAGCVRVRLACAWPILIGQRTLHRLRQANVLDVSQRIKISRGEVWRILVASTMAYPVAPWWRRLFREELAPSTSSKGIAGPAERAE